MAITHWSEQRKATVLSTQPLPYNFLSNGSWLRRNSWVWSYQEQTTDSSGGSVHVYTHNTVIQTDRVGCI